MLNNLLLKRFDLECFHNEIYSGFFIKHSVNKNIERVHTEK